MMPTAERTLALSAWSIVRWYCHAFEQIISLYVDSILEQSIAIKQIAAYLKVAC
jgi:hypothetical protein